jgi:hypothetical protein
MAYSFESIAQLDHSREFARLHQKFHQFNPLKVSRVDQFEIRHSNVLALFWGQSLSAVTLY